MGMESSIIAKVYLVADPFEPREVSKRERIDFSVSKRRLIQLLAKGWVQFTYSKVDGKETSFIATLNRFLYTYSFKGGDPPRTRGLLRFVVYNRRGTVGVWRSAYTAKVSKISEFNKNQAGRTSSGKVRQNKNRRVDVNSHTSEVIDWDYIKGRPL